MGAECRLAFYADGSQGEPEALAAAKDAFAEITALEDVLSDWRVDSEVTRLNGSGGKGPQAASATLLQATQRALAFAESTGGAFDPTVMPLVRLWRDARAKGSAPDPAQWDAARAAVDWRDVVVDASASTIELKRAGAGLDFGGIGMGLGADAALRVLRERGFARAMVDFSGDIACGDAPPGKDGWTIAVGVHGAALAVETVTLVNQALAASGPTEQAIDVDGAQWSHVIDPRSGKALTQPLVFTVIASDATTADALSTAASVLGRMAGRDLVNATPGARLIVEDPRFTRVFGAAEPPSRDLLAQTNLSEWQALGDADGYRIVDGVLEIPAHGGGTLRTNEVFRDFALTLEFQLAMGANSGLFLRAKPGDKNPAYSGCEIQLIDDYHWGEITGTPLKSWQHSGSLYGAIAAPVEELEPIGSWNRLDVLCAGSRLAVALNGVMLYDVDTHALKPEQGPPFAERVTEGYLGLQRYGAPHVKDGVAARFRSVRVRDLSPQ
ncbi:MAG: FAD:protein FMN transferase [Planctomycetes bacterium]|nr:FAD:protein FMN transferase [Planctomycetota bacterium]MCC7170353.1 FAD:protein FMN transferase [Planctomycetota bacterium]